MSTMNASEIISVLKSEIADFDRKTGVQETGTVVRVGDGIATVFGMQRAMYGELVEFETGVRGIVQNLEPKTIGVVLLGSDYGITEGTSVVRTGKRAGIGVSPALIGRVVDALGSPIDGGEPIAAEDYFPVEREAAGVAERKSVTVPLQTGILSIDAMFPIGRGQRELIIGDRQTGKTSIAVDTIINQKGQDVICIYVAIGQKSSTVAKIVSTLKKNGAMDYSIVVSASASEPAPVQYLAPYSGTAIAEYFMSQGKDVLIVYDDLSKHAVAYRAMSLLLHRPPGREAYPGDVFYVGLSVSRVGGAAQTKAMKKVAGQMRVDLAQFREMEVFTQFSSDLDPATQAMLDHGHVLMELLKQPLYHPLSTWKEVIILAAASNQLLDDIAVSELREFREGLTNYVQSNGAAIVQEIQEKGTLSPENLEQLLTLVRDYKKQVN